MGWQFLELHVPIEDKHGGVSPVIYRIMIDEGTEIVCFPQ
jgi:hypothetical protein